MSENCMNCVVEKRTGPDLLCDKCRPPRDEKERPEDAAHRFAKEVESIKAENERLRKRMQRASEFLYEVEHACERAAGVRRSLSENTARAIEILKELDGDGDGSEGRTGRV